MKNLPVLRKREGNKEIWLVQPVLKNENAKLYASWLNDPRVVSGIGGLEKVSEIEAYELLRNWNEDPSKLHWFIHTYEGSHINPVGDLNLDIIPPKNEMEYSEFSFDPEFNLINKKAEIKIMVSGKYQQRGIGKLAAKTAIEYGFDDKELLAIYASVYRDNRGSLALFEKLGFETMGYLVEKRTGREEVIMRL